MTSSRKVKNITKGKRNLRINKMIRLQFLEDFELAYEHIALA